MLTKTYGIRDMVEYHPLYIHGKAKLRVHFTGGVLDDKRTRPATCVTSNRIAMIIIENQAEFKSGRIFIVSAVEDGNDKSVNDILPANGVAPAVKKGNKKVTEKATEKTAATDVTVEDDGRKIYGSVTTIGEAVNILMDLGAKAGNLQTNNDVIETALSMNVAFPNLKLK